MLNWTQRNETEQKQAEGSAPTKLTVETLGTHIYFYSSVNSDRCLALMRELRGVDNMLRVERVSRNLPGDSPMTPIWLHINSNGGSLFDGLGMADQISTIKSPIYSVVEGCVASAGTLISMSCTKRYILPSAFILLHQLSSFMWGTYEQFKDEMHVLDMAMETMTRFYKAHSSLREDDIKDILTRDSWFNAEECLANGFVDEVYS